MNLACNLEARGRWVRVLSGLAALVAAIVLVFCLPATGGRRLAVLLLTLAGIFLLFEGLRGWCALRALGIKTPL
jgi:uncharacterized membrane protein HdeD (DUF308 family)